LPSIAELFPFLTFWALLAALFIAADIAFHQHDQIAGWARKHWRGLVAATVVLVILPATALGLFRVLEAFITGESDAVRNIGLFLIGLVGAPFLAWRSFIAQAQADTAAQGMITDRINKAVEGLGAEKTVKRPVEASDGATLYEEATEPNLEVRIGGALALERIAKDSPNDRSQIMEILCAYIRENACVVNLGSNESPNWQQRSDTQTAVKVLGRWAHTAKNDGLPDHKFDLRLADLRRTDFSGGEFSGALLGSSDLSGSDLGGAKLRGAHLRATKLANRVFPGADLKGAHLVEADLTNAYLTDASFVDSDLTRATFVGAIMGNTEFGAATLDSASFALARFRSVDLSRCTGLAAGTLAAAFGVRSGFGETALPAGLEAPDHWLETKASEVDTPELQRHYFDAFNDWMKRNQ